MLIEKLPHDGTEYSLGDLGADLDVVVAVLEDFWLDDWDETILLANGAISCQLLGVLFDGGLGWQVLADLEDGTPLSETAAELVVLCAPLAEFIEALGQGFVIGATNGNETSVDFDATVDPSILKNLREFDSLGRVVAHRLVKHDDAADVLTEAGRGKEQLSVRSPIVMVVLDLDVVETFADCAS